MDKWAELLNKDEDELYKTYNLPPSVLWERNGVDIQLKNNAPIEANNDYYDEYVSMKCDMRLQKLIYFCSCLGVDMAGEGNIKRLMDIIDNYNMNVENLLLLPVNVFEEAIGINGVKFYNSLHKALDECSLCKFMDAVGAFGQGIGELKLQKIYDVYHDLPYDRNKILEIEGWAEKTVEQYMNNYIYAINWIKFLFKYCHKTFEYKEVKQESNDYAGLNVVFTGIRDKAMENVIVSNGGKVLSSISKNCNLVITKDVNSSSSKITKAKSLNIQIISYEEALKKFQ